MPSLLVAPVLLHALTLCSAACAQAMKEYTELLERANVSSKLHRRLGGNLSPEDEAEEMAVDTELKVRDPSLHSP